MKTLILFLILLTSVNSFSEELQKKCEEKAFEAAIMMEAMRPDAEGFHKPIRAELKEHDREQMVFIVEATIEGNNTDKVSYLVKLSDDCNNVLEEPVRLPVKD